MKEENKLKATDLRIGNKFLSPFGKVETVLSIIDNTDNGKIEFVSEEHKHQYSHVICCEENGNQYKPIEIKGIPLNEEWLLKLGFKYNINDRNQFILSPLSVNKAPSGRFKVWYIHLGHITTIDYVHQLQNLYHALTGTELTLK